MTVKFGYLWLYVCELILNIISTLDEADNEFYWVL